MRNTQIEIHLGTLRFSSGSCKTRFVPPPFQSTPLPLKTRKLGKNRQITPRNRPASHLHCWTGHSPKIPEKQAGIRLKLVNFPFRNQSNPPLKKRRNRSNSPRETCQIPSKICPTPVKLLGILHLRLVQAHCHCVAL